MDKIYEKYSDFMTNHNFEKYLMPSQPDFGPRNYDGFIVIGAGLPRTGTASLRIALEKLLKGRCYHMRQLGIDGRTEDRNHWRKVLDGNVSDKEWVNFLQGLGFRAGTDSPICFYFKELMRAFPKAKVVLTVRDPEKWYESVSTTIGTIRNRINGFKRVFEFLVGHLRLLQLVSELQNYPDPITNQGMIDAIEDGREASVRYYNNWISHVKNTVPPEKLLIFESKQGWAPLCNFLDIPIPEEPYPRVNDSGAKQMHMVKIQYLATFVVLVFPILAAFLITYKFWY